MVLPVSLKWSWPCDKNNQLTKWETKVDCRELSKQIIFTNQYQILLSLYFLLNMTHWMLSSAEDKQVLWWASSDNGLQDYSVKKKTSSSSVTHIIISFSKFFLFVSKYLSLYLFSVNSFYLSVTCMMECSQSHLNINDYIQRG